MDFNQGCDWALIQMQVCQRHYHQIWRLITVSYQINFITAFFILLLSDLGGNLNKQRYMQLQLLLPLSYICEHSYFIITLLFLFIIKLILIWRRTRCTYSRTKIYVCRVSQEQLFWNLQQLFRKLSQFKKRPALPKVYISWFRVIYFTNCISFFSIVIEIEIHFFVCRDW